MANGSLDRRTAAALQVRDVVRDLGGLDYGELGSIELARRVLGAIHGLSGAAGELLAGIDFEVELFDQLVIDAELLDHPRPMLAAGAAIAALQLLLDEPGKDPRAVLGARADELMKIRALAAARLARAHAAEDEDDAATLEQIVAAIDRALESEKTAEARRRQARRRREKGGGTASK